MGTLRTRLACCAFGAAAAASGCDSGDDDSGPVTYSVKYVAAAETGLPSGTAELTAVLYDDGAGHDVVVSDPPADLWAQELQLLSGDSFSARAEGTLSNGRLRLQVQLMGEDGSLFARTAEMPFETGDYYVTIPRETLP